MGSFFTFLIFHAPSALKRRELHVLMPSRFDDFGRTNPILIGTDGAEHLNSARYLGQHAAPPTDAERSPSKLTLAATTATRDLHPCPRRYIAIIYTHLKRTVAVAAMPRWAAESSSFNSQPGTWRTFQIITRLEITNPEGNTQTLVPVPAVKADWFKSLGNEGEESASQRAARRHARHEMHRSADRDRPWARSSARAKSTSSESLSSAETR